MNIIQRIEFFTQYIAGKVKNAKRKSGAVEGVIVRVETEDMCIVRIQGKTACGTAAVRRSVGELEHLTVCDHFGKQRGAGGKA